MEDIQEFLADFEQVPEARNLHGVRKILEELQAKNEELRRRLLDARNELHVHAWSDKCNLKVKP